jgi:glycosyltransferase involved in cell wall biosynthesis
MKILHLINSLSAGGAELHLLTLCRELKKQNVEIVVGCLREHVKGSRSLRVDFEKEGIKIIALNADSRYECRFLGKIARILTEESPDILHTHLPRADLAGAWWRLLNPVVPWVCSVHDIHDQSWSGRWTLPLFNFIWPRADRLIAISHAVKDWLVKKRAVPAEKVSVVHYGIEPEGFSLPESDLKQRWALEGKLVIGTIGRLEPRKGHDCLLYAMAELRKIVPGVALIIAGHDPWGYGKELQSLIERLDLRKEVRLAGFQGDIAAFLSATEVFAFATQSEGFGQAVIEAMAAAKPVVASKIAPLTEIVVEGKTGFLVQGDDPQAIAKAVAWLFAHPEQAREMGKHGQARVHTHFSAEKMSEQTLLLYDDVLRERRSKRAVVRENPSGGASLFPIDRDAT